MRFQRHSGRKLAAIYLGGVLGALGRVGLAEALPYGAGAWPWATFAVNIFGAFLIGYFFASFRDHDPEQLHHPFFATGICGTLTTFSTLQLELYEMAGDHLGLAGLYCTASLALGYLAVLLGAATERYSLTRSGA
jgi:fluoride exporter